MSIPKVPSAIAECAIQISVTANNLPSGIASFPWCVTTDSSTPLPLDDSLKTPEGRPLILAVPGIRMLFSSNEPDDLVPDEAGSADGTCPVPVPELLQAIANNGSTRTIGNIIADTTTIYESWKLWVACSGRPAGKVGPLTPDEFNADPQLRVFLVNVCLHGC